MNPVLKRRQYRADGIFSDCFDEDGVKVMVTLEHAYGSPEQGYLPKIPPGVYKCMRGMHRLEDGVPFETFEVMGISGHDGLLFHAGNWNKDSNGCILVGNTDVFETNGTQMITKSRVTFAKFMELQAGLDEFTLTVVA